MEFLNRDFSMYGIQDCYTNEINYTRSCVGSYEDIIRGLQEAVDDLARRVQKLEVENTEKKKITLF